MKEIQRYMRNMKEYERNMEKC